MRFAIACIVLAIASGVAVAEDKVLVLRAEGRADKTVRTKIEGAVLKLAAGTGGAATAGDVTFGDAAMMVGCKPEDEKCKDEVLGMLAVDEIIAITAMPKPGGIEVSVRRISKGGATRNGATLVTADKADQLEALTSLFEKPAPLPPPVTTITTTAPIAPAPMPEPAPTTTEPPAPVPEPTTTATIAPLPGPIDEPRDDQPRRGRRLAMFGMAGGGALLVIGIVFWASAANIEDEIDDSPKRTRADLEHIQDLEAQGDGYATAGNLLAVGGLILGGVSTYFFMKSNKSSTHTAVTPIINNGTGIAITWGGSL